MVKRSSPTEIRRDWLIAGVVVLGVVILGPRPGSARLEADLAQAVEAVRSGQPAAALDAIERAMTFEPALASLHLPTARIALDAGSVERAAAHLGASRSVAAETAQRDCLEREVARLSGSSATPGSVILSGCPEDPSSKSGDVAAFVLSGDFLGAIETLKGWLDLHPEDLTAWEDLAGLTFIAKPDQARTSVLRALQNHPTGSPLLDGLLPLAPGPGADPSPEGLARAGELFAGEGRWAIAAAAWERAIALEPEFPQASAFLGIARLRLGLDGIAFIEQAAAAAPDDPIVRSLLGQALLDQGDIEGALRELGAARDLDAKNPAIAAAYGDSLAGSGDYQAAAAEFLAAAELASDEPAFWILLSEFSLRYGFEPGTLGLSAARNAVALRPDDPAATGALGFAWHMAGDSRLAERLLRRSLELDPMNPLTWYRHGLVLLDLGRADEAAAALRAAAALDPIGDLGRLAGRALDSSGGAAP